MCSVVEGGVRGAVLGLWLEDRLCSMLTVLLAGYVSGIRGWDRDSGQTLILRPRASSVGTLLPYRDAGQTLSSESKTHRCRQLSDCDSA